MAFAQIHDTATPRLRHLMGRVQGAFEGDRFLLNWATAVRKEAMTRCIAKGGRRLWREIARSIMVEGRGSHILVEAQHVAAAQKQFGGPIRAKGKAAGGADYLTIPIKGTEAEGMFAAKFALAGYDLFALGMEDDDQGVLGYSDENDEFFPLFILIRETAPQRADPFMPDESEVGEMGVEEAMHILGMT